MSPAGQPCTPARERALKRLRTRRERVEAEQILEIKAASADGASSYAIGKAIGLSHSHVQRILRGDYDKLLKKGDDE